MGTHAAAHPIRVLVVDDDLCFADLLGALVAADGRLELAGTAANGEEALARARMLKPDVVLMDVSMPLLDGIEATRRIRALRPEARVIVVSGSAAPADIDAARRAGAAGYVLKENICRDLIALVTATGSEPSLMRGITPSASAADHSKKHPRSRIAWPPIPA